jgi:hypothetical protein
VVDLGHAQARKTRLVQISPCGREAVRVADMQAHSARDCGPVAGAPWPDEYTDAVLRRRPRASMGSIRSIRTSKPTCAGATAVRAGAAGSQPAGGEHGGEPVATWQPADGEHGEEPVATCNRQTASTGRHRLPRATGRRRTRWGSGGGLMACQAARRRGPRGSWTSIGALECKRFFTCTERAPVMGSGVILACRSFEVAVPSWTAPGILNIASEYRTRLSGTRTITSALDAMMQHGQRDDAPSASRPWLARRHTSTGASTRMEQRMPYSSAPTHSTKNRPELTLIRVRHARVREPDNYVRLSDDIYLSDGCAVQRCLLVNARPCLLTLPGGTPMRTGSAYVHRAAADDSMRTRLELAPRGCAELARRGRSARRHRHT